MSISFTTAKGLQDLSFKTALEVLTQQRYAMMKFTACIKGNQVRVYDAAQLVAAQDVRQMDNILFLLHLWKILSNSEHHHQLGAMGYKGATLF